MSWRRPDGLQPVFGLFGCCHLLWDENGAVLIDTGLLGEVMLVQRALRRLGLPPAALHTILLTHGHLDHTAGAAALQRWSGARVLIHADDLGHLAGRHPYPPAAWVCDRLERIGRAVLRYEPPRADGGLTDGLELPCWGGLRVVHLPGHTAGHCGFWSERHQVLFCGDLFANYGGRVHPPPRFLNTDRKALRASLRKVAQLNPRFILPNHVWRYDGAEQRRAFDRMLHRHDLAGPRV